MLGRTIVLDYVLRIDLQTTFVIWTIILITYNFFVINSPTNVAWFIFVKIAVGTQ